MTRDETLTAEEVEGKNRLKQEAEEYVCKKNPLVTKEWFIDAFKKYDKGEKVKYLLDCEIAEYEAYIAGAEPREKQIQIDAEQIRALQKQNGELTDKVRELEQKIEKMKWHKVSDGDLPKDRHNVYVMYMNGYYQLENTIASFRHKYWVFNGLKTECEVIAWCELPKWEIKEK